MGLLPLIRMLHVARVILTMPLLFLLVVVISTDYLYAMRSDLMKEVHSMLGLLTEVHVVYMRCHLARNDRRHSPIKPVHPRYKLIELVIEPVSVLCVRAEPAQYMVLVLVVKLIPVCTLVEVFEQLALARVT